MLEDDDEFLTVAQIAERLKLNQQTVRNWIDRGELEGVRLGSRRVRVRESELRRFIEHNSTTAAGPDETEVRNLLENAWFAIGQASTNAEEAAALRRLARSASLLARLVSR